MRAIYATDLSDAMETAIGSRTCLDCLRRYGLDEIYLMTVVSPDVGSGLFHCLRAVERDRFVDELARVLRPGGVYLVLGDARRDPRTVYGSSPAELRDRFRPGEEWTVEFVLETVFERRNSRNPAYVAGVRRQG